MDDAQGHLGQGNADSAVDSQGRALDALRKGAQGLAQSMQQQMGQGPGTAAPAGSASRAPTGYRSARPAAARARLWRRFTVKVPGEIDVQRARRIIEELRKRFGDLGRPQEELDYIERLLEGLLSPAAAIGKIKPGRRVLIRHSLFAISQHIPLMNVSPPKQRPGS